MTPRNNYTGGQMVKLGVQGQLLHYGNLNAGVGIIKIQKKQEKLKKNYRSGLITRRKKLEKDLRLQAKKLGESKNQKIRYNARKERIEKYVGRKKNFRIWKELTDKEAQVD